MSERILREGEAEEAVDLLLLVESLAQEATEIANKAEIQQMLERRLGSLLRTGQEMRNSIGSCAIAVTSKQDEIIQPAIDRCLVALSAWNVAWREAKGKR